MISAMCKYRDRHLIFKIGIEMKKFLTSVALLLVVSTANATPFGFAADGAGTFITQGYQGFNYDGDMSSNSWVNNTSIPLDINYGIGPTTLGAAWSNGGSALTMTRAIAGQTFNMGSLSLNAGFTESVTLNGYLNGALVDSWTGVINNQFSYTKLTLNWTGIDQLDFSAGANLFITDIDTSTNVPEPATLAMFGLGLFGLAAARRRKQ
jgi:hypothetical protein